MSEEMTEWQIYRDKVVVHSPPTPTTVQKKRATNIEARTCFFLREGSSKSPLKPWFCLLSGDFGMFPMCLLVVKSPSGEYVPCTLPGSLSKSMVHKAKGIHYSPLGSTWDPRSKEAGVARRRSFHPHPVALVFGETDGRYSTIFGPTMTYPLVQEA